VLLKYRPLPVHVLLLLLLRSCLRLLGQSLLLLLLL
jgi:hypothetical protein